MVAAREEGVRSLGAINRGLKDIILIEFTEPGTEGYVEAVEQTGVLETAYDHRRSW